MYLWYVIGKGELNIDTAKMEGIMKWMEPTNVSKVHSFVGVAKYMRKFIASFLVVAVPLHVVKTSGKSFQWEKGHHWAFEELNKKI